SPISRLFPYTTLFRSQPFWNQFVLHSFYRHGGVGVSIPQPQSIHPPISILQHQQFSTGYLLPTGFLRRKWLRYALLSPGASEVRSEEHTSELQSRFDL